MFKVMLLCEELTVVDKVSKNNWREVKCWKWSSLRLIVEKFDCWFISLLFVVVFFSGVMVSCLKEVFWFLCFIVDFRKVPKHFLSFNIVNYRWTEKVLFTALYHHFCGYHLHYYNIQGKHLNLLNVLFLHFFLFVLWPWTFFSLRHFTWRHICPVRDCSRKSAECLSFQNPKTKILYVYSETWSHSGLWYSLRSPFITSQFIIFL